MPLIVPVGVELDNQRRLRRCRRDGDGVGRVGVHVDGATEMAARVAASVGGGDDVAQIAIVGSVDDDGDGVVVCRPGVSRSSGQAQKGGGQDDQGQGACDSAG